VVSINAACAAELRMLSAGAVEPGLRPALAAWEKDSGNKVTVTFATAPQIRPTLDSGGNASGAAGVPAGGEFDLVIAPPAILDELAKSSAIDTDVSRRVPIGRVGIGVVVRPGAPLPDISSADALKRALLEADSVVFNRGSTGVFFETVLKRLNIEAQVLQKTTRYADGAAVMQAVLDGHGREIGFGAITEALLVRDKGLRLVGPLPGELQNYTTYTAAAIAPRAGSVNEAARALLRHLDSAQSRAGFIAAGIDPAR
jgi:molybdate transport system substrate-binding protein